MTTASVPALLFAPLVPGQVQVWLAEPDRLGFAELEARHGHLLDDAERARHGALRFARDRHLFLAAHALTRRVLGAATGIAPARLAFASDPAGKPRALLPATCAPVEFNLSHSAGLVACAVTLGVPCGIDVELRRTLDDMMAVAGAIFTPGELAALSACAEAQRATRFLTLWTLREAYAKATGEGIAADLSHLSFTFDEGAVAAHFRPGCDDGWQFHTAAPGAHHLLAVAAHTRAPLSIVQHTYAL